MRGSLVRVIVAAAAAACAVMPVPVVRAQQIVPIGGGGDESVRDPKLAEELRGMMDEDQAVRKRCEALGFLDGVPMPEAFKEEWDETDRRHLARLKEIVKEHGWPGVGLVGRQGEMAAFLVAQHGDPESQRELLPRLEKAVQEGDASPGLLAYLTDRVRIGLGQKQLYGTQLDQNEKGAIVALEVEDPARVDELRAEVGMPPLATYLKMVSQNKGKGGGAPKDAGPASDPALQSELVGMFKEETSAKYRAGFKAAGRWGEVAPEGAEETAEKRALREELAKIRAANLERVRAILKDRGWPRYSEVGHDGARGMFQIARRLEGAELERAAGLMEAAAKAGDASKAQAAWLVDFARVRAARPQVYGTQVKKGADGKVVPHEVEDEAGLGARREEMGLPAMEEFLRAVRGE